MNKTIRAIIAVLLALLLGISIVVDATIFLPEQFDHLYLGELADKYLRLRSFDNENKIIVIGGSSVAFGINSQLMEEYLGMPVVNFGLYGPLGTTIMMDLTRGHINEGDIIVLAPETDEQTMSMYFNGEAMWECADSDFTMLLKIRPHNWGDMIGSFWQYAQKKFQFYLFGKPEPDGVYDHDSFNEYGDIIYTREEPVMEDWYDPDVLVNLDSSIVEDEFIDYVNEYIAYCESQGATVYYSWPPMNYLAVEQDYAGVLEYATYIRENINCQVISNISDYIMDAGYFYDTNYHVTDQGAIAHTAQLIQDLENFMGNGSLISISRPEAPASNEPGASGEPGDPGSMPLPKGRNSGNTPTGNNAAQTDEETESESVDETVTATPAPTATPVPEVVGSSQDAEYFTYDVYNEGLMLTGVTEEGKAQTSLEVPWMIDGQKVIAIGQNTFDGCDNLKSIYIQSNITRIMQNAFDGCARLTEIHIDNDSGTNILIPGSGLFDNVSSRTKVYVPKAYYGNFLADYFWGNYNDRLVAE